VLPCRLAVLSVPVTVTVYVPAGVPPCRVGGGGGVLLPPPQLAKNTRASRVADAVSPALPFERRVTNRPSKGSRMAKSGPVEVRSDENAAERMGAVVAMVRMVLV